MSLSDWLNAAGKVGATCAPIVTFLIGKATKGATNQVALDQACADIKHIRDEQAAFGKLLERHTTLHEGQLETNRRTNQMFDSISEKLGELKGQISALLR